MEHTIDAFALNDQWQQIILTFQKTRRLDEELFKDTFAKTYQLLKGYAKETKVEKDHIPVIISAHTFSMTDRERAEAQSNAAFVLTERMIHRCLIDRDVVGLPEGAAVYILEERKEVYLDFNDVTLSLNTLAALMHNRELL